MAANARTLASSGEASNNPTVADVYPGHKITETVEDASAISTTAANSKVRPNMAAEGSTNTVDTNKTIHYEQGSPLNTVGK